MKILACNAGSTSLKFKLFEMPGDVLVAEGKIERVGSKNDAIFQFGIPDRKLNYLKEKLDIPDYTSGIKLFMDCLCGSNGAIKNMVEIGAVCFKTVLAKGFYNVHYINDEVMKGLQDYMDIAGSHNGPYISAINEFKSLLPKTPMVGVFETAFHQTIPLERQLYGIPYDWYKKYGVRKMGYHGASHNYISSRVKQIYGNRFKLISCHLGGSGSINAIMNGKSIDNSFGFSLHTGLMHAARAGDTDTSLIPFLSNRGLSMQDIMNGLTKQGGLLGISGISSDLRYVEEAAKEGNKRAILAINVYCSNIIHYIGAFYADLGGLDCLVFTGGIGENSHMVRHTVCAQLAHFGIRLDEKLNQEGKETIISASNSAVKVLVIPTNEELGITQQAYEFIKSN